MHLEDVEAWCIEYLAQTAEPVVTFDALWRFVKKRLAQKRTENDQPLSEETFLDFIKHHEKILYIESPLPDFAHVNGERSGARFVLLRSRKIEVDQLLRMMSTQAKKLEQALQTLLSAEGDSLPPEREEQIRRTLARVHAFEKKLDDLVRQYTPH
jgi:hypothetical protein